MTQKLIFLGLNEFNPDLLLEISKLLPKNNFLSKICKLTKLTLPIKDTYDSGYLEPWSQWVSVHTSKPTNNHKIKNLGDIPSLKHKQVWELLSKNDEYSIVWGAMNASLGKAKKCELFVPDPWVFTENTRPSGLSSFISLPRYLAKNYTSISKLKLLKLFFIFIVQSIKYVGLPVFFKSLFYLFEGLIKFGSKHFVFINFFDYLTSYIFINKVKNSKASLNFIFLNSVAHCQHHYWKSKNPQKLKEIIFTYQNINRILEVMEIKLNLFSKKQPFIIFNGLSQSSTFDENSWYLYRVKNIQTFMKFFDISFKKIETLMTHDAHMFFDDVKQMKNTIVKIKKINIESKPIFFVEEDLNNKKIFFRLNIHKHIDDKELITLDNKNIVFGRYIKRIVKRTGKHIQQSDAFHNLSSLKEISSNGKYNYDIFPLIYPNLYKSN